MSERAPWLMLEEVTDLFAQQGPQHTARGGQEGALLCRLCGGLFCTATTAAAAAVAAGVGVDVGLRSELCLGSNRPLHRVLVYFSGELPLYAV